MMKTTPLKNTIGCIAFAVSALAGSPLAGAAETDNAVINDITVEGTQYARVSLNIVPAAGSRPSCHNASFPSHYAFDVSTAKGKALLSALQAAQLAGKQVTIVGQFVCTNLGNEQIETLGTLTVWT